MKIEIKVKGIEELKRNIGRYKSAFNQVLEAAVLAGCLPIQNEAKQRIRKKTRTTASSIHSEIVERRPSYAMGAVGSDSEVARHLEFGTKPHVIVPKNKKALYWPGAAHPVKKVSHPGTPPYPFLRPAYDTKKNEAIENMRQVFARVIR